MGSSRFALLCALALALPAACARSTLEGSVADEHGATDATTELDFWDGLATQTMVSNHDALHALLLYFGGKERPTDYAGRLRAAQKKGWVREGATMPPNETARVGWIARAICMEAGIEGGLTMRAIGPHERYAVRELNYMGWLPEMSGQQSISGGQLLAVLGRADDYRAGRSDKPKGDS